MIMFSVSIMVENRVYKTLALGAKTGRELPDYTVYWCIQRIPLQSVQAPGLNRSFSLDMCRVATAVQYPEAKLSGGVSQLKSSHH